VILDTPHVLDPNTLAALDHADVILLVTTTDLVSLYTTKRAVETFRRLGYGAEKIRLVVNRYAKNKEVPLEKVEDILGQRSALALVEDMRGVLEAINMGKPLALSESKSPLVRQFAELATLVAPVEAASGSDGTSKRGVLHRLFGGGRR
jgi:pilus assembly protein CpaE